MDPARKPPTNDIPRWQYVAAILIPAIPFVIVFARWTTLPNIATAPSFSDSVEMINAFLSSAAFAAVILTLLLQRRDLHEQSRQFHETMQLQVLSTYLSLVESRREIIACRPVVADDADIRTLHLALSVSLIGKSLDRIELLLDRSAVMGLDAEHAAVLEHGQRVRSLIARVATFDVARNQLEADRYRDAAVARMQDWLAAQITSDELPAELRLRLSEPVAAVQSELATLASRPAATRAHASLTGLERELAAVRTVLVCGVRRLLYQNQSAPGDG